MIQENEKSFELEIEHPRKHCICPCCGQRTDKTHDYRRQQVKELPYFGKRVPMQFYNSLSFRQIFYPNY